MSEPRPPAGPLLRNSIYTAIGRVAGLVVGILVSPLLLESLGERHFGLWVLAYAVGHHLNVLSELGSGTALTLAVSRGRATGDTERIRRSLGCHLLWLGIANLGVLLVAALILVPTARALELAPDFHWRLDDPTLGLELLVLAIAGAILRPFGLAFDNLLQGCERFDLHGRLAILRAALWLGLSVAAVKLGLGARGLLLADMAVVLVLTLPGTWLALRELGVSAPSIPTRAELTAHLRYGFGVYIPLVTELLSSQTDKLIVGGALGPVLTKSYEFGQKVTLPARSALVILSQVLFPRVPGLIAEQGMEGLGRLHERAQRALALVSAGSFAVLAGLAPTALAAWLGPARVDEPMVLALRLLALAYVLNLAGAVPIQLARGLDRLRVEIRAALLFAVVGLILRIGLMAGFGFHGLLVGTALSALGLFVYQLFAFAPVLGYAPLDHLRRTTLPGFIAAVVAGGLAYSLDLGLEVLGPIGAPAVLGSRGPALVRLILVSTAILLLAGPVITTFGLVDDDILRRLRARLSGASSEPGEA